MSVEQFIKDEISELCGIKNAQIDIHQPLTHYGLDSVRAMMLIASIEDEYDFDLEEKVMPSLKSAALLIGYVNSQVGGSK